MRFPNYHNAGFYSWMQTGQGHGHTHGHEGTNPDMNFSGGDFNINYMNQQMHWVNQGGHPMDRRDRNNEEKYDRISINNINFSKYLKITSF